MFIKIKRKLLINKKINAIGFFALSFLLVLLSFGYSVIQNHLMVSGNITMGTARNYGISPAFRIG